MAEDEVFSIEDSTWGPQDVWDAWTQALPRPEWLKREDGRFLVYRGVPVSFIGPSESAKSWVAAIVATQALREFERVWYIDFESTLPILLQRLRAFGATRGRLVDHLWYINPSEPLASWTTYSNRRVDNPALAWLEGMVDRGSDLVILDGVTEALALHGLDANSGVDVARWQRLVVEVFGEGTIEIDHTGKDPGRGAVGSVHKRAGITQQITFEVVERFGIGREGRYRLKDTKDRIGGLGQVGIDGVLGTLVLRENLEDADLVEWKVEMPEDKEAERAEQAEKDAWAVLDMIRNGVVTSTGIESSGEMSRGRARAAIKVLRDSQRIVSFSEGGRNRWHIVGES